LIRELYLYLTTKTSKEARQFGHLYECIAINSREKRCGQFWKPHRENCKKTILEYLPEIKNKNSVLVLGSGPLHEIPIEALSYQFNKVDLVDIVHLKTTKKVCRHLHNVNFIEADLTELEENIFHEKKIINKIPSKFTNQKYDLVISANILSQLPNHLVNFLKKNNKYNEDILEKFRTQVCNDHYLYLQKFSAPTILFSDTERSYYDPMGNLIEKESSFIKFGLPEPVKEWDWNLAPIPEASKEYSIKMKVSAFILNF
jgi:hypothetical protein